MEKLIAGPKKGCGLSQNSALVVGPNRSKQLISAPNSNTWPMPGSSLDLDFANNKGFVKGNGQGGVMDQLTFTRASAANYIGSDGLLHGRTYNLCASSENFYTGGWSANPNIIQTLNACPDPLGGNNGIQLFVNSAGGNQMEYYYVYFPASTYVTFSYWVKAGNSSQFTSGIYYTSAGIFIPVTTTLIGPGSVSYVSSVLKITGLDPNIWTRVVLTTNSAYLGNLGIYIYPDAGQVSSNGKYNYFFGVQFEQGTVDRPYQSTSSFLPRFDWTANTLVPRNLLNYTESFDSGYWSYGNTSITPNVVNSPIGTLTADNFVENSASNYHYIIATLSLSVVKQIVIDVPYTFSIYIKVAGRTQVLLGLYDNTFHSGGLDLSTVLPISGTNSTGISTAILDAGNGWYRCSLTYTITSVVNSITPNLQLSVYLRNGTSATYQGDGTSGVYLWGAQFELGSQPSAYQPVYTSLFNNLISANIQRNLLPNSQCDNYCVSNGTTPPTVTNSVTWQGQSCTSTLFTSAMTAGYANSRMDRSVISPYEMRAFISNPNTYIGSCYISLSRALTGSEAISIYYTGVAGLGLYTLSAGNCAPFVNTWVRINFGSSATAGLTGTVYPVIFLNGIVGSNLTIYTNRWQLELGTVMTNYQVTNPGVIGGNTQLAISPVCNGILIEESRINLILWCRDATNYITRNLLKMSQDFANITYWTSSGISTGNTIIAPDSTNTGRQLLDQTNNGNHYFLPVQVFYTTIGRIYTYSIYVKKGVGATAPDIIQLTGVSGVFGTSQYANFNINAGTILTNAGGTAAIVSAGSGWWRISWTAPVTLQSDGSGFAIVFTNNNDTLGRLPTYIGQTTSDIYIWGAQLELASTVSTYEPVLTVYPALWSKQGCTAVLNQIGIDGVSNTATLLTATSTNAICLQHSASSLPSNTYTSSVYLYPVTVTGGLQITIDGVNWSDFELLGGWQRVFITQIVTNPCLGIKIVNNGDSVIMDFAQVELGQCVTSPILSVDGQSTRAAEVISLNRASINDWFNNNIQSTTYALYKAPPYIPSGNSPTMMGSTGNIALSLLYLTSNVGFYGATSYDGFSVGAVSYNVVPLSTTKSAASMGKNYARYAVSNGIYQNPVLPSIYYPNNVYTNFVYIGSSNGTNNFINSTISRLVYFPKRATNHQLQLLTKP